MDEEAFSRETKDFSRLSSLRVMCNDNIKAEFYHVCYDSDIKLGCHLTMFTYLNSILCFVRRKEAGR